MKPNSLMLAFVLLAATAGLGGCGLKSSLTLPPKSDEIVIRPGPTTVEGEAAPAAASPAPAEQKKVTPKDDRLPPPPLPGGNPGTVRGG